MVILFSPLQLSVAVACPVLEGSIDSSQLIVNSIGQVSVGATSSMMVMICSHVASLPQASTAVHILVIVPALPPQSDKVPPFTSTKVIVMSSVGVQLSAAIALPPAILGSVS